MCVCEEDMVESGGYCVCVRKANCPVDARVQYNNKSVNTM